MCYNGHGIRIDVVRYRFKEWKKERNKINFYYARAIKIMKLDFSCQQRCNGNHDLMNSFWKFISVNYLQASSLILRLNINMRSSFRWCLSLIQTQNTRNQRDKTLLYQKMSYRFRNLLANPELKFINKTLIKNVFFYLNVRMVLA